MHLHQALSKMENSPSSARNQEISVFSVDQSLCDCLLSYNIMISFLHLYNRSNLAHLPKESGGLTSDKWVEDTTEIQSTPSIVKILSHNLS